MYSEKFCEMIAQLEISIGIIFLPSDKNRLFLIENPNEEDFLNINCVHFNDYVDDNSLNEAFNSALTSNLRKRYMVCTGLLSQKRLQLLE